jgi:hypothetical protein
MDDGHDHLPLLRITHDPLALTPAAVTRGEPRRRPFDQAPVSVPPAFAGFPDRDTESTAPPPDSLRRREARSDVHGSLDRAKDVSSVRQLSLTNRVRALVVARADDVPLLFVTRGHLLSSVRALPGNEPHADANGPIKTHVPPTPREGCRHLVNQGAFHRCDSRHECPDRPSRSRRPHVFPMAGASVLDGHCKHPYAA